MKKRLISMLLVLVMLCTLLPQMTLFASAEVLSGTCGAEGDTAAQSGYTTYTCSRCGDSYVDSYTDPLGYDYTVTFSVLGDTGVIAPMVCNTLTGITLPEAEGPNGYRFLGWVAQDVDNVTDQPDDVLTGAYTAPGDVTLLALFTYNNYGGKPPKLEKMSLDDSFSDGDKIVIVESGGEHGLYHKKHNYAYVSDFDFTEDAEAILADELTYFLVTEVEDGWYLGDEVNGWLYTPDNTANLTIRYNMDFMTAFTLTTLDGHLALQHTVSYNDNVFYVNCATNINGALQNKWRMVNANNMSGVSTLDIYKLIEGGPAVARYTTMLHTHSPGEAVRENEIPATCTEPGGYDSVVWCTICGEELSREAVTVEALGHTPGEPERENELAATCEAAGSFDLVVCCTVCGVELSREHVDVAALGHDWDEPEYVWSEDNGSVTATRICKHDASHVETETVNTSSEVTKEATYAEEGEITYTAVFENEAFATQSKVVATPKLEKPENPFDDVTESDYFYEPVLWAVGHEPQITNGTDPGKFSPNAKCTRGQVVTFLWRAMGAPEPEALNSARRDGNLPSAGEQCSPLQGRNGETAVADGSPVQNPFDDVKADDYYFKAVLWAVENGITAGTGNGKFSPNQGCTRGQVVTFLWRTEGKPEPVADGSPVQNPFSDVKESDYFYTAVLWAVEKNITQGTGNDKFSPIQTCTRGQIVTFLYRDLAV